LDANTGMLSMVHSFDVDDIHYREDLYKYVIDYFGGP